MKLLAKLQSFLIDLHRMKNVKILMKFQLFNQNILSEIYLINIWHESTLKEKFMFTAAKMYNGEDWASHYGNCDK